ncbi:MAG: hypothetical protein JXB35_07825, partial [Anaerolineae bacterium]|nr:hypothetical protein [Anaerolineae bacterium]
AGKLTGEGVIAAPIGNAKHKRSLLVVAREGRAAQTFYRALHHYREGNQTFSLLEVRPESARLDQIRVHLSWYGYPVVGDSVYGLTRQPEWADRLFLHLSVLEFPHPDTEAMIHVESELPPALRSVLTYMSHPRQ